MSNSTARDLFNTYSKAKNKPSQDLGKEIESAMKLSRKIFTTVDDFSDQSVKIDEHSGVLSVASKYLQLTEKALEKRQVIRYLESGQARSHIHNMGGDIAMEKFFVAEAFLENRNVEKIYLTKEGNTDLYLIIVKDDDDDVSLELSTTKIRLSKENPEYYFEISYITLDEFYQELIPADSKCFER